jgi:hypothetical protein
MKKEKLYYLGALLIITGLTLGHSEAGRRDYLSASKDVLSIRGLAPICHSCNTLCGGVDNGPAVTSCSGAIQTGCDDNDVCDDAPGDGTRCGPTHTTYYGPYDNCVVGDVGIKGQCGTPSTPACYKIDQCECNDFAYDECECGPYEYQYVATVTSGC